MPAAVPIFKMSDHVLLPLITKILRSAGSVNNPVLQDLITATGDFATLPNTVVQLLDLLKGSTCSASKVVKVFERDLAMTANILKLINSAFYGSRRKISHRRYHRRYHRRRKVGAGGVALRSFHRWLCARCWHAGC
ncbi:MAG: hypothetical protein ACI9UK_001509 [Candidatus Krumholzibacteriia bacterium]|jgi:hypothetical protein